MSLQNELTSNLSFLESSNTYYIHLHPMRKQCVIKQKSYQLTLPPKLAKGSHESNVPISCSFTCHSHMHIWDATGTSQQLRIGPEIYPLMPLHPYLLVSSSHNNYKKNTKQKVADFSISTKLFTPFTHHRKHKFIKTLPQHSQC